MKRRKISGWLGALALGVALLAGGCGDDAADAPEITMPPVVATAQADVEQQVPVDVYWDATYSMQGYTTLAAGNIYRTLPDELGDLGSAMGEVRFYRFGESITELKGREYRQFSNASYYTEVVTSFGSVIDAADPTHLSVVVTDLFESDSDWSNVTQKLKEKYFAQHLAVGIIGIRSSFNGDIFDVGLSAAKFNYNSADDPAKFRPFYLFIMGPEAKVEELMTRYHDRTGDSANVNYLLLSENMTDVAADFSKLKIADMTNLYEDSTLDIKDKRIREFGISDMDKDASLTIALNYEPRIGALPLAMDKLRYTALIYSLADGEWQANETDDDAIKADIASDGDSYSWQVHIKPDALAKGKVNFLHVALVPDEKSLKLPDWVRAWNMANVDVDPNAFDGSKTINLVHVVESLRASALAAARPALANINMVIKVDD